MLILFKQGTAPAHIEKFENWLLQKGLHTEKTVSGSRIFLLVSGEAARPDAEWVRSLSIVEAVQSLSKPYRLVSREVHMQDTVIEVGGHRIGGGSFSFFAGPCSVERYDTLLDIAAQVQASGAQFLRAGAFKPRTSPYSFQGMRADGIEILKAVKKAVGMPIISEIMDIAQLPLFEQVDILQVGARNMQNFELLKALGKTDKPIFLKRGFCATLEEFLMSAEYILAEGNEKVILCERGIRTFETETRSTLDLSAVPILKEKTHLPVVVDPSHALGVAHLVRPMSFAAAACGADGLMLEVHSAPALARSDAAQSVLPSEFAEIVKGVRNILEVL